MDKQCYLYLLASKRKGALFVGLTANLVERVQQHKEYRYDGFTSQYNINRLVYFEYFSDLAKASQRETVLKQSNRKLKLDIIEFHNPDWLDLYQNIIDIPISHTAA